MITKLTLAKVANYRVDAIPVSKIPRHRALHLRLPPATYLPCPFAYAYSWEL